MTAAVAPSQPIAEPVRQAAPDEILANWEGLFEALRKATPSSPEWFGIIDMAVGVLVSERLDALRAALEAKPAGEMGK